MAKQLGPIKVTLTSPTEIWEGNVPRALVSSTNGGLTHEISLGTVNNFKSYPTAFTAYAQGGTTPKSAAMTKREAVIKHVLEMAKAVDKQQFEGARLIEQAVEENNLAYNAKMHQFQLAVLSALHEGITDMEVEAVLLDTNLPSFNEEVQAVARRDMQVGYLTSEDASVQD